MCGVSVATTIYHVIESRAVVLNLLWAQLLSIHYPGP